MDTGDVVSVSSNSGLRSIGRITGLQLRAGSGPAVDINVTMSLSGEAITFYVKCSPPYWMK